MSETRDRIKVTHPEGGVSMTKQADKEGQDINRLMNNWISHGQPPPPAGQLTYGDFADYADFHTMVNRQMAAQEQFDALPAVVRRHVDNDPGKFLDMVRDPERVGELEELGLIEAQKPADVQKDPDEKVIPEVPKAPSAEEG
jgi:hypothetical protein